MSIHTQAPYCGVPPAPSEWAMAWNGDWRLLAVLALCLIAAYQLPRRGWALGGWAALVMAFVSPLCALTVALFSARAGHHLWLLMVAAPLLGAALPAAWRCVSSPLALGGVLTALVLWHVPSVYAWAWDSHMGYWALQLGLLLPAVLWWAHVVAVLRGPDVVPTGAEAWSAQGQYMAPPPLPTPRPQVVAVLVQMAALAGSMGLIGAVLTFAPRVLYPQHGVSTLVYGMLPLEDQQLAGLLMWVPGFVPLAVAAALVLRRLWQEMANATHMAQPASYPDATRRSKAVAP